MGKKELRRGQGSEQTLAICSEFMSIFVSQLLIRQSVTIVSIRPLPEEGKISNAQRVGGASRQGRRKKDGLSLPCGPN